MQVSAPKVLPLSVRSVSAFADVLDLGFERSATPKNYWLSLLGRKETACSLSKSSERGRSRLSRFLRLRDAFIIRLGCARPICPTLFRCVVGRFLIHYNDPGCAPGWSYNLQIWPPGGYQFGMYCQGNKVVNVNWDEYDRVDITTFRGGLWEEELLALLESGR